MKSDAVKKGVERAPHRSLLYALGCTPAEMDKPFIGVINSFSEIVPGHMHLREIAEAVKAGVRSGGGVPFEVNTIAVCDGIAQHAFSDLILVLYPKPGLHGRPYWQRVVLDDRENSPGWYRAREIHFRSRRWPSQQRCGPVYAPGVHIHRWSHV